MDRKCSLNSVQKCITTEFLKNNPALQSGKFSKEFTFKKAQALWEEVTTILNSVPNGAKKERRQWRKTWQDLKKNSKAKAVSVKKHTNATGGGEPALLSKLDTDILDMISPSQVNGLLALKEPTIKFDFERNGEKNILVIGQDGERDGDMQENNSDIDRTAQCDFVVAKTGSLCSTVDPDNGNKDFLSAPDVLNGGEIIGELVIEHPSSPELVINNESLFVDHDYNKTAGKFTNTPLVNQTPSTGDQQDSPAKASSSINKTPRKINKTARLTKSLDISDNLVNSIKERNKILNNYYSEKVDYLKKDLQIKEKTVSVLNDIRNILQNVYGSNP